MAGARSPGVDVPHEILVLGRNVARLGAGAVPALRRRVGVVEAVAHRHAVERMLLNPTVCRRHLQPGDVEDGGHHVGGVVVLMSHLALGPDPGGPVDHHRIAGAAGEL